MDRGAEEGFSYIYQYGHREERAAGRRCPCYRMRGQVTTPYPVLTFPATSVIVCPLSTLPPLIGWYRAFKRMVHLYQEEGRPCFSPMNMAPFPCELPRNPLVDQATWSGIEERHHRICQQVRMAVTWDQRHPGAQQDVQVRGMLTSAMEDMETTLSVLAAMLSRDQQNRGCAGADDNRLDELVKHLEQGCQTWLASYETFQETLLQTGNHACQDLVELGDWRLTALGKAFYGACGCLRQQLHHEELRKLEQANRAFHGLAAVEATQLATLRKRGITPSQFDQLQAWAAHSLAKVKTGLQTLQAQIAPSLRVMTGDLRTYCSYLCSGRADHKGLGSLIDEITRWEQSIDQAVAHRGGIAVLHKLPHSFGTTSQALANAMLDPGLSRSYRQVHDKIYLDHFRMHMAGTAAICLASHQSGENALAMLTFVHQESRNLVDDLALLGDTLGLG